jgi:hypothetical protein
VWYDSNAGPLGAFFWNEHGSEQNKQRDSKNASPMHKLTDVFVGAVQPIFATPVAASAVTNNCLSLVGAGFELHIETLSPEVLSAWLGAIQHILTSTGNSCVVDEGSNAPSQQQQQQQPSSMDSSDGKAIDSRRRFSIMAKAGLQSASLSASDVALKHVQGGALFTRFERGHAKRIALFYVAAPVAGELGTFYWSEGAQDLAAALHERSEERSFPLRTLTDLFLVSIQARG